MKGRNLKKNMRTIWVYNLGDKVVVAGKEGATCNSVSRRALKIGEIKMRRGRVIRNGDQSSCFQITWGGRSRWGRFWRVERESNNFSGRKETCVRRIRQGEMGSQGIGPMYQSQCPVWAKYKNTGEDHAVD